ncbi:MAG: dihydroorotate dehydrogenase [Spirochaetes bacterium GWD1_27_9]|nr:MAG: dihydroorotate dehydrogenase [Spirochaetes bacterium GWB1_27_13]OHD23234.1 MAG: dihydroorotate dehydrogenase [Spirochaetes bacterium GWC1_27_15]OHD42052.1 MAG: dihydroorotate dehydrogenase [Spirochaetes bacterium GWD1_27_9]
MFEFLRGFNPVIQALFATLFTWGVTALGASFVFFTKEPNKKMMDMMLGFAGGVMIAASFWSLLAPSIELASLSKTIPKWIPPTIGFVAGCIFIRLMDRIMPHLHLGFPIEKAEGIKTNFKKTSLLVLAITLHNIPEGLAVGVAFGSLASNFTDASFAGAVALALGIGIQNFPEGFAISMPLRAAGLSKFKSFNYGQLSAIVEPIAAVIGASLVIVFQPLLPYALAFAAGAMIYVVVEEVIPESQLGGNTDIATLSTLFGFVTMMILDVALG